MMKKLMLLIVSIALLTGFLSGCTQKPAGNNDTAPNNPPPLEEATPQETASWPRAYVDALGREVILEKKPERVALLFFRNFEHLFLLDEFPIAATDVNVLDEWESLAPYRGKYEITDVGSMGSPNVEKLLDAQPDLIIMFSGRYEAYGETLEKIAPVITVDSNENNWQGALLEYGEIFGKEQKAQEEIERIEKLIADSRNQLEPLKDKRFGVIMLGDKQFWAFTTQFVFNQENGLGLNPPDNYVDMSTKGEQISLEGLAAMKLDYMLVADIGGSTDNLQNYLENLEDDLLWNSLDAVKKGRMYTLDSSIAAGGPLGIELGVKTIIQNITQ